MKRFKKIWDAIIGHIKRDQNPQALSTTAALGMILGLFPVVGTTTILCLIVSIVFKRNMIVIQLGNYLVYPLQLILFVPMIKFGSYIFKGPPMASMQIGTSQNFFVFREIWINCLYGIVLWFIVSIPTYLLVRHLILRISKNTMTTDG
jgi:uncharacterized protein (DUF2062 family)